MKIIFGIGNPGSKYALTRHNAGFLVLDKIALRHNLSFKPSKFDWNECKGEFEGEKFCLIKPVTYVNKSGIAALDSLNFYGCELRDFLVVVDDVNLDPGRLRIRQSGSDGGHNGIKSLIYYLESGDFPRLRFGIGNEFESGDMADFVLSEFTKPELTAMEPEFDFAAELTEAFISGGFPAMMNRFSTESQNKKNNFKTEKSEGN